MFGIFRRPLARPPLPAPEDPAVLRRVAGYRILAQLAYCDRHRLYRAVGPDGRQVALRILEPRQPDGYLRKLRREIVAQREVRHPALAHFWDQGTLGGEAFWMARDFLAGPGLLDDPPGQQEALHVIGQVAAALHELHERQLLCPGLKPNNLLRHDGRWVLCDFGISPAPPDRDCMSVDFAAMLSLAPEEILGQPRTPQGDLYCLGRLAYELLTGEPPFDFCNPVDFMEKLLGSDPRPPAERVGGISEEADALIMRLLDRDPSRRLAALEVARSLPPGGSTRPELTGFLDELRQQGRPQDSGEFTLDSGKALEKLSAYQFAKRLHPLLPLLAAASALGAERLTVTTRGKRLELFYRCPALAPEELETLFAYAFERRRTGLGHLALGVAAVLHGGASVELASGRHELRLTRLEAPCLRAGKETPGVRLMLRLSQPPPEYAPEELARLLDCARPAMTWNGRPFGRPPGPVLGELPPYRIFAELGCAGPSLALAVDGMVFETYEPLLVPFGRAVLEGPFALDLSYQAPILPAEFPELRRRADELLLGLAEESVEGDSQVPAELVHFVLDHWEESGQPERADVLLASLLTTRPDEPELQLRACRWVTERGVGPVVQAARLWIERFASRLESWQQLRTLARLAYEEPLPHCLAALLRAWGPLARLPLEPEHLLELVPFLRPFEGAERLRLEAWLTDQVAQGLAAGHSQLLPFAREWALQRPACFLCEDLYAGLAETDARAEVFAHLLAGDELPDFHPLWLQACLETPGPRASRILMQPTYFTALLPDWEQTRQLVKLADLDAACQARFLVWAWLQQPTVQPPPTAVGDLLGCLAHYTEEERTALDPAVAAALSPLELRAEWEEALPAGMPLSLSAARTRPS